MTNVVETVPRAPAHRDAVLWCALGLAFVLRAGLLALYPYSPLTGDEGIHYVSGVLTAELGTKILGMWPPAYEAFLGAIVSMFGPAPRPPLAAQVVLSTLTVGLVYGLANGAGGRRAGRIAAFLAALHPSLIAYSNQFFSETLFLTLLTGAAWTLFPAGSQTSRKRLVLAGVLFGLATLTRSAIFYALPVWLIWLLVRRRVVEARRFALVLGVAAAVVLPWTIRNWNKYDGFLFVDGTMGRRLYLAYSQGEHSERYGQDLGYSGGSRKQHRVRAECPPRHLPDLELPPTTELARLFPPVASTKLMPARQEHEPLGRLLNKIEKTRERATLDLVDLLACEKAGAIEYARTYPGRVVRQSLERIYAMWGPNSFLLRSVHASVYPTGPLAVRNYGAIKWFVVLANVSLLASALLALGPRLRGPPIDWGLVLALTLTLLHALSEGSSRYRLPLVPFLIVMSAAWLAAPRWPEERWRAVALGLVEVAFAALAVHYVANVLP